jgi:hypothetical protein
MSEIFLLALTAAFNPTELAATTLMLVLPSPARLLLGYWLGAMLTGIASGLVIVFAIEGTTAEHTTSHTVSPIVWLVFAALLLIAAFAVFKGEDKRMREFLHEHKKKQETDKNTPKWQRMLREGNARHTFAVGILLSFPGVSYFAALDRLIHLHYSVVVTVLVLIGFNLVQNILLELPMLAFMIWPNETPATIDRAKAWAASHGRPYVAWALGILGVALAIISVIGLLKR